MTDCRSCGEPIRFAKTKAGKLIPIDVLPDSSGNIVFEGDVAIILPDPEKYEGEKFVSHFVTCPDAERWRKK